MYFNSFVYLVEMGWEIKRHGMVWDAFFPFIFESKFSKQNILRTICPNYEPFQLGQFYSTRYSKYIDRSTKEIWPSVDEGNLVIFQLFRILAI
jgi:hypothetical protein